MSKRERTSTVEKWIKEVDGTGPDYRSAHGYRFKMFPHKVGQSG